jgi:carboxymethylenebutenolidase
MKPTQEMLDLYNAYAHSQIDRRTFMDRLSAYAVGGVTVSMLAGMLLPNYAEAQQFREDDPQFVGERIVYKSPDGAGEMGGYLVRRKDLTGRLPAILVVHENRGLNPHIADVARRAAHAGYLAFAPDALYPLGGYPGNDDDGREMQAKRDRAQMLNDFVAAADVLLNHSGSTGKVGVTGFCYGGSVAAQLAIREPRLAASVPYYGSAADPADAAKAGCPLMVNLASNDERVNASWPPFEAALKAAGKSVTVHTYPDTNHGFHNDTTPRFAPDAAKLAWDRTIAFFDQHLKA